MQLRSHPQEDSQEYYTHRSSASAANTFLQTTMLTYSHQTHAAGYYVLLAGEGDTDPGPA